MGRSVHPRQLIHPKFVVPIVLGGTNAETIEEAINNLHLIPNSSIDVPGGIAETDNNNLVKVENIPPSLKQNKPAIYGKLLLGTGEVFDYILTDFNSFKTYSISVINGHGSISRLDDFLTYTAPMSIGGYSFVVNNYIYDITVFLSYIQKPVVSTLTNINSVNSTLVVTGTIFTYIGRQDEHQLSEIQVTNEATVAPINNSKTDWIITALYPSTTYTVRIRYKGLSIGFSEWSDLLTFTTRDIFTPTGEVGVLSPIEHGYGGNIFVDMSNNSDIIAMGDEIYNINYPVDVYDPINIGNVLYYAGYAYSGKVFIYTKQLNGTRVETGLLPSDISPSDGFGRNIAVSGDGIRIAVCSPNCNKYFLTENPMEVRYDVGAVYVFVNVNNVWELEQKLYLYNDTFDSSFYLNNGVFGNNVCINTDGSVMAVSQKLGNANYGAVYVYDRIGSVWSDKTELVSSILGLHELSDQFGKDIAISGDGSRVFASSPYAIFDLNYYSNNGISGAVTIFKKELGVWIEEQIIYPPVTIPNIVLDNTSFGIYIDVDQAGETLVISAVNYDQGPIYVYKRTGTTWNYVTTLGLDLAINSTRFGSGITISGNGKVISISASGGPKIYNYFFNTTSNTWELDNIITPTNSQDWYYIGRTVALSNDGSTLVAGCDNSINNHSEIRIFN
jgi:hypothetical protein